MSYLQQYIIFQVHFTIYTCQIEKYSKQKLHASENHLPEQSVASMMSSVISLCCFTKFSSISCCSVQHVPMKKSQFDIVFIRDSRQNFWKKGTAKTVSTQHERNADISVLIQYKPTKCTFSKLIFFNLKSFYVFLQINGL